jgi:aldehyde dehydrogenase (NAD+)
MIKDEIIAQIDAQKNFFKSHLSKSIPFRIEQLNALKLAIISREKIITEALWHDLHKSYEEAYLTEISLVIQEINYHIKKLKNWAKPKRVSTPIYLWPSQSKLYPEPLGLALIISPWNYPFQLTMSPLIGAISAGCTVVLKPSPDAPKTSAVMAELIADTFPKNYISLFEGGIEINQILLQQRFDIIFFTGSTQVGKIVSKAAAEFLTPVVLELGGKSPCIVDKRIIWGKTLNAGQTCIAPDYVYVHISIKEKLIEEIKTALTNMFGSDLKNSAFYPRIIHAKAFTRLQNLMQNGQIRMGGELAESEKFIAPTLLDNIKVSDEIMQEEIFGPLLPVLTFEDINEPLTHINNGEKPLALYYFGSTEIAREILHKTSSGGACINDTIMHVSNHHLPFGGVGNSGQGSYHGKRSFETFSHFKSVVVTPTFIDLPFKYAPFKYFKFIKNII